MEFPPIIKALNSTNSFFLGNAGVKGLQINDNFVKFTAIGVYLGDKAMLLLADEWKAKTAELTKFVEFFRDIIPGYYRAMTVLKEREWLTCAARLLRLI